MVFICCTIVYMECVVLEATTPLVGMAGKFLPYRP